MIIQNSSILKPSNVFDSASIRGSTGASTHLDHVVRGEDPTIKWKEVGTGPRQRDAGLIALDFARGELGTTEATGRNDGIPAQRYSGGRHEPWCANFVAWTFQQAGRPLPGVPRRLAGVQYMEDQMKRAGLFHKGRPKPGDIIFFANRGPEAGVGRHVGLVDRVEGDRVHTIEGNSANGVRERSYAVDDPRISGYGRR